jgi:hypothetical protein
MNASAISRMLKAKGHQRSWKLPSSVRGYFRMSSGFQVHVHGDEIHISWKNPDFGAEPTDKKNLDAIAATLRDKGIVFGEVETYRGRTFIVSTKTEAVR